MHSRQKDAQDSNREYIKNGKLYTKLITNNGVREKLIPNREGNIAYTVLSKNEYTTFKNLASARVRDEETQKKKIDEFNKKTEEYTNRKTEFLKYRLIEKPKDSILKEYERKAMKRIEALNEQAHTAHLENEDELKTCKAFITQAQCLSVLDFQIEEMNKQREIEKERAGKVREAMKRTMDQTARDILHEQVVAKRNREAWTEALRVQVLSNIAKKELELAETLARAKAMRAERLREEAEKINKEIEKVRQQAKTREEILESNERTKYFKRVSEEESKMEDEKLERYLKKKAEEADALEKEKQARKSIAEQIAAKLRADQLAVKDKKERKQKFLDEKAELERNLKESGQHQERVEKKIRGAIRFKEGLDDQLAEKLRAKAEELEREKQERAVTEWKIREAARMEQLNEMHRLKTNEELSQFLLHQIHEGEFGIIDQKRAEYEDDIRKREEREEIRLELEEYMNTKFDKARDHHVKESRLLEARRKMHAYE